MAQGILESATPTREELQIRIISGMVQSVRPIIGPMVDCHCTNVASAVRPAVLSQQSETRPGLILLVFLSSRLEQNVAGMRSYWSCLIYDPKPVWTLFLQVTIFLHFLWAGPLQAIAVTILLWVEIGISCLAGMAVLVILLPLQSCIGKLFSSLR